MFPVQRRVQVTITTGPLKGATGFIKRVVDPGRVVVALDFLAAKGTVEVSASSLDGKLPIHPSTPGRPLKPQ